MRKTIIITAIFFTSFQLNAETLSTHIVSNENTKRRSICHVEFEVTRGLSVNAKLAPAKAYHSRANNERYAACPYDVVIKYENEVMRLDFGNSFDLESVKKYKRAFPVNSGFFIYDGQDWSGQPGTMQSAENDIRVTNDSNAIIVTGLLSHNDPNSKVQDYCYAIRSLERCAWRALHHSHRERSGKAAQVSCDYRCRDLSGWQVWIERGS